LSRGRGRDLEKARREKEKKKGMSASSPAHSSLLSSLKLRMRVVPKEGRGGAREEE